MEVKTHSGNAMPAIKSNTLSAIDVNGCDMIGVDEAQFFKDLDAVLSWVSAGKHVVVAGLSGDFQKRPFDNIARLIPHADDLHFKKALCTHCGKSAAFSRRVIDSEERLLVGGEGQYEPVCRSHYLSAS